MTFDEILAENYEENIRELEEERSKLVFRPEYDGTIVEKYVTCKRPNCICHRGYPHGSIFVIKIRIQASIVNCTWGRK